MRYANAQHIVRLPHDVMPNPSILDIGTSLVKHLFPWHYNITANLSNNLDHEQFKASTGHSQGLHSVGSSLMGGLFAHKNVTRLRSKRGLLNMGGTIISHHPFGVATFSQLNRYRLAMKEVAGQQADMMHAYVSLALVVKQTRTYARQLTPRAETAR